MPIGKALIFVGLVLVALGVLLTFGSKLPLPFGRLPGDILIKRGNFTFSFPIVSSLLISLVLTLLLNLFFRR